MPLGTMATSLYRSLLNLMARLILILNMYIIYSYVTRSRFRILIFFADPAPAPTIYQIAAPAPTFYKIWIRLRHFFKMRIRLRIRNTDIYIYIYIVGMHRISGLFCYPVSGWISGRESGIPDIRPISWFLRYFFYKLSMFLELFCFFFFENSKNLLIISFLF